MITRAIENCFNRAKEKWWNKTYWGIDIHETLIIPNYDGDAIPTEWYPFAQKGMKMLSERDDVCLFLFTCSYPREITKYFEFFKDLGIEFQYANKNPEVPNNAYGYYRDKPYWNVLFEDKAGFDPIEWPYVISILEKYPPSDWSKYTSHFDAFIEKSNGKDHYWDFSGPGIVFTNMGIDKLVEILRQENSPHRKESIEEKMKKVTEYLDAKGYKYEL